MPFQPGNQWGKLGKGVKSRKTMEWDYMALKMVGEANTGYLNLMERLFAGDDLSKPELEAMNRYEKMLNYFKPQLARTEVTGKDGGDLKINLVNYGDDKPAV